MDLLLLRRNTTVGGTEMKELHVLASAVHGALSVLHALGVLYNVRKKNWKDVAIHTGACIYGTTSVIRHIKDVREDQ